METTNPETKPNPDPERKRDLAMIHLAKKELGLDDDLYRTVLKNVTGAESAGDLDQPNRRKLLAFFRGQGFGKAKGPFPGKPLNMNDPDKGPMLGKIEAMLAEARRPWAYADGMADHMFHVKKIGWCKPDQLHKIIVAMMADAKRHNRRTE